MVKLRSLLLVASVALLVGCGRAVPVASAGSPPQPSPTGGFSLRAATSFDSSTPAPGDTSTPTPSPADTSTPTPTPVPPESTPTPVPPPTPTPTPAPTGLLTFSGSGPGTSPQILWPDQGGYFADLSFTCSGPSPSLTMYEWVNESGTVPTGAQTATFTEASHSETEEYPYPQPGSYYGGRYLHVEATADCNWTVSVRQRPAS